MGLEDFTIYVTLHTTPTKQREALFDICMGMNVLQGCKVVVVCDEETEEKHIKNFEANNIEYIKIPNQVDGGLSKFLFSIQHCKTKWCAIVQDDDYYVPNHIVSVNNFLEKNNHYTPAIIISNIVFVDNGIVTGIKGLVEENGNPYFACPSRWIINTELCRNIEYKENTHIGWDRIIPLLCLQKGSMMHYPYTPIIYNFHSTNYGKIIEGKIK